MIGSCVGGVIDECGRLDFLLGPSPPGVPRLPRPFHHSLEAYSCTEAKVFAKIHPRLAHSIMLLPLRAPFVLDPGCLPNPPMLAESHLIPQLRGLPAAQRLVVSRTGLVAS